MRSRSLVLILVLCVALVWVWSAYRFSGDQIVEHGLFWTAAAIALLLAYVTVERLGGWFLAWWRRRPAKPPAEKRPAPPMHEDDLALANLWKVAEARLASSPELGAQGSNLRLQNLPLTLLVGPSGCGKTSTLANSGIEPHLLAGEVRTDGPIVPTKVANFWIDRQNLLVEISGRIWSGDIEGWRRFLRGFLPDASGPLWKRLWREQPGKPAVKAVVLFDELPPFLENAKGGGRAGKQAQERVQAIVDTFGFAVPVYVVFAKADSIKFHQDFYGRLLDTEARQALGYAFSTGTDGPAPGSAEALGKQLNKALSTIAQRLADRRVLHLGRETDAARKPRIYEHPREFRRHRPQLVQFLVEAFQPNPLTVRAQLRGVYFTATRRVESAPKPPGGLPQTVTTGAMTRTEAFEPGVTQVFRPDATMLFRPDDPSMAPYKPGGTSTQWMFVRELFEEIIPKDSASVSAVTRRVPARSNRLEQYRQWVTVGGVAMAVILGLVWIQSWWGNRQLLAGVRAAMEAVSAQGSGGESVPEAPALRRLDDLRKVLVELDSGSRWSLHWGLYAGDRVRPEARRLYFRRFQAIVLSGLNQELVRQLARLPAAAGTGDPYESAYRQLWTHLTISGEACKREPTVVAAVLKQQAEVAGWTASEERKRLVERQIDYYAAALGEGDLPARVSQDAEARDRARAYLRQVSSPERVYCGILDDATRTIPRLKLRDLVTENLDILKSSPAHLEGQTCPAVTFTQDEVSGAFSIKGKEFVEQEAGNNQRLVTGDRCVLGDAPRTDLGRSPDARLKSAILRLYVSDYKRTWKAFLSQFSVAPYASLDDATRKLTALSDYKSPALGLLVFVSQNTYFPKQGPPTSGAERATKTASSIPGIGGLFKKGDKTAEHLREMTGPGEPEDSPGQVTEAFDVTHRIAPPDSPKWITDKTQSYTNALSGLRLGLETIARAGQSGPDAATIQQAQAAYDKAQEEVRALTTAQLAPTGAEGVDTVVSDLLRQPILRAKPFIPPNPEKAAAGKLNRDLAELCAKVRKVLVKYPFSSNASQEATLDEVAGLYSPARGAIWGYQKESLGELVVKQGARWLQKPEVPKPRVSNEVLTFLNRSQEFADAIFPGGGAQPKLTYSLRPLPASVQNRTVIFGFDGVTASFSRDSLLQRDFVWPAPAGKRPGAEASISIPGGGSIGFAKSSGQWGVFRIFAGAETRSLGAKLVEWKWVTGAGQERSPIDPPVQMEFVQWPGGQDLFNPAFFRTLACPVGKAAE